MTLLDRIKRKVLSRLTDEVDVLYFDEKKRIDNKVAQLIYKNREVIVEKQSEGFVFFWKTNKEYNWRRTHEHLFYIKKDAIEGAKNFIKDDTIWRG